MDETNIQQPCAAGETSAVIKNDSMVIGDKLGEDSAPEVDGKSHFEPQDKTSRIDSHPSTDGPAKKPRGPRTAKGKAIASKNALKHGIFSTSLFVAPGESRAEYKTLLSGLREHFQPVGTLEDILLEKLAVSIWRYRRLIYSEAAEIRAGITPWRCGLNSDTNAPDHFPRYEASVERSFDRILTQLERIQRMRLGQPVAPPVKVDISS
ncbi:MAG: hypothetical protein WB780_22540 [Candidatus Acidiferrales bacterium]